MKKYTLLIALAIILCTSVRAQDPPKFLKSTGIQYYDIPPTHQPSIPYGTELIFVVGEKTLYKYDRDSLAWFPTATGGGSEYDIAVVQDSILQLTKDGVVITSDTIRGGGGTVTGSVYSMQVVQDSIIQFYEDGVLSSTDTIRGAGGGTIVNGAERQAVLQFQHGFAVGDFIAEHDGYYTLADLLYRRSQLGIIDSIIDDNNFLYTPVGSQTELTGPRGHVGYISNTTGSNVMRDDHNTVQAQQMDYCRAFTKTGGTFTFFGNSITVGAGSSGGGNWTSVLCESMGAAEQNFGIGGTTMQNTVSTVTGETKADNFIDRLIDGEVPAYSGSNKDLLFIGYGTNDMRIDVGGNFSVQEFASDYRQAMDSVTGPLGWPADQIVIIGGYYIKEAGYSATVPDQSANPASRAIHHEYNDTIRAIASAYKTRYVDTYSAMTAQGANTLVSGDNVHPINAGHAVIAQAVEDQLTACQTAREPVLEKTFIAANDIAQRYIDSVGTMSAENQTRIHYFTGLLEDAELLDKARVIWPMLGSTTAEFQWNLLNPAEHPISTFNNAQPGTNYLEGGNAGTGTSFPMFAELTDPNEFTVYSNVVRAATNDGVLWGIRQTSNAREFWVAENRNGAMTSKGFGNNGTVQTDPISGGRLMVSNSYGRRIMKHNGVTLKDTTYTENGTPPATNYNLWLHSVSGAVTGNARIGMFAVFDYLTEEEQMQLDQIITLYENATAEDLQLIAAGSSEGGSTYDDTELRDSLTAHRTDINTALNRSVDDADADDTNELQTLSVSGYDLTITGGNTVGLTIPTLQNVFAQGSTARVLNPVMTLQSSSATDTNASATIRLGEDAAGTDSSLDKNWLIEYKNRNLDFEYLVGETLEKRYFRISPSSDFISLYADTDVTGTMTATNFSGDGSGLTNVPGDDLGNHTATTDLGMGANNILFGSDTRIRPDDLRVGDAAENITLYSTHATFTNQASDPVTGIHSLFSKETLLDGLYKNRLYYKTHPDDASAATTGSATYQILTDADVPVQFRREQAADAVKTSGSIDTDFTISSIPVGRYKVELYLRIESNTIGGGVAWFCNSSPNESGFQRLDSGQEQSWTAGDTESNMNADQVYIYKYSGIMHYTAPGSFSLSTGPNGTGNLTLGAGSYVIFTELGNSND